jgi:hypothetical protein
MIDQIDQVELQQDLENANQKWLELTQKEALEPGKYQIALNALGMEIADMEDKLEVDNAD